jgi:hypothetical protein
MVTCRRRKLVESDMDVGGEGWNMTSSLSEPEYTMLERPAEKSERYQAGT